MDLRKRAARAKQSTRGNTAFGTPLSALAGSALGEVRVSNEQIEAYRSLYMTSPSMQAARSVLLGQLLSSGIVVRRKGEDVPLTEGFAKFLESTWIPFARRAFDELMVAGFVAVSIEEEQPEPFAGLGAPPGKRQKVEVAAGRTRVNYVPEVCEPGSFQVSFVLGGRAGYRREYHVQCMSPGGQYDTDEEVGLFFRQHPDSNGHPYSPVACCFEHASFVSALIELALQAEVTRSRTQLVTQAVPKHAGGTSSLDAASLFFDSESREIQQADKQQEAAEQAAALSLVSKLCATINRLQTRGGDDGTGRPSAPLHAPPEVPPRLFTIPEKQQLAPPPRPPEARSDLEALMRQSNDAVSAAMGVPASVIFEVPAAEHTTAALCVMPSAPRVSSGKVLVQLHEPAAGLSAAPPLVSLPAN